MTFVRKALLLSLIIMSVFPTSCSSSQSSSPSTSNDMGIGTQDIWFYDSFRRFDETGESIDITDQILAEAMSSLGSPQPLNPEMTFRETTKIEGRVVDEDGELLPSITLEFGVLDYGDRNLLVAISSANLEEEFINLDQDDFVDIDLSFIDEIEVGDETEMDYVFAQTIVPDDVSKEEGLTHVEIFLDRWNNGDFAFLGIEVDDKIRISEMYGQSAVIVEGSKFWRYTGKAMTVSGDTITGGAQGVIGGGGTGAAVGAGVGLLGGPFAAVSVPAGAAWGGLVGVVIGGWAGTIGGFLSSAGAAIERNNPAVPPPPPLQQPPATSPPVVPTNTPAPTPTLSPIETILLLGNFTEEQKAQILMAYLLDPEGDWIYSQSNVIVEICEGKASAADPTDIRGHLGTRLSMSQPAVDLAFNLTDFPCDSEIPGGFVVCTENAGPIPAGDVYMFVMKLAGDVLEADPDHFYTYAVVVDADGDTGNNFNFQYPYDWDYFQNTDRWYGLNWDPNTNRWDFSVTDTVKQLWFAPSAARAVVVGNTVTFFVPGDEITAETPGYRLTAFGHDGYYTPSASIGDVTGADPTEPLTPVDAQAVVID